jgi:two-component system response regulator MtrA
MRRVLLVNGDKDRADSLAVQLQANGYQVSTAHDVVSALGAALAQRPDLMVLDLSMPGGAGLAVAERVRKIPFAPPVVFMTAPKEAGLEEVARRSGAAAFLEDPYEADDLVAAIRAALHEIGWGRRAAPDGTG